MKKIVALSLAVIMLLSLATGCGKKDDGDKGAIINAYLVQDPSSNSLDPGLMLYNAETAKILNLIFEGLTTLDENGKVKPGLAKSWRVIEDAKENTYKMQFELNTSRWSDGRQVSAEDVVYAWKRILEPSFSSNAAALLYPIKNARQVREGEMTIDDLGLAALDITLLEVEFEGPYDYDYFLQTVASPALVPLREDVVTAPELWTEKVSTIVTNGPFVVKAMEYQKEFTLERSVFYMTDGKNKNQALDKFVKPYRFVVRYQGSVDNDLAKQVEAFKNDEIFYLGGLNKDNYGALAKDGDEIDMLNMYTYYFNTTKAPLDKPEVRKALSIAISRDEVASIVGTGVKPVTGFVPVATIGETPKKSFREEGKDVIPSGGDIAGAKSLLASAGVSGGSITLKIRANTSDIAVGNYVKGVWESLGFSVTVQEVKGLQYVTDLTAGDFDVMALDYQCLTQDAYGIFAPFALKYSGGAMDFNNNTGDATYTPHITKFNNEAYNAKVEEASLALNAADRTKILHELETLFVDQSPAMALYSNVNFVSTKELSGITFSKFGLANLAKTKMANYQKHLPTETSAEIVE